MPFNLRQFLELRPYLYHLTASSNLKRIGRERVLHSTSNLFTLAGQTELSRRRRQTAVSIRVNGDCIHIRDQTPLHQGSIQFDAAGWSFEDVVAHINKYVFFWPGDSLGPKKPGRKYCERYRAEHPVILRMETQAFLDANPTATLLFSRYNSGAPRCSGGAHSPRGPRTFVSCEEFSVPVSKVVEMVVAGSVKLPSAMEASGSVSGPWGVMSYAAA